MCILITCISGKTYKSKYQSAGMKLFGSMFGRVNVAWSWTSFFFSSVCFPTGRDTEAKPTHWGPSDAEVTTPARVSQRSRGRVNQRGMSSKASEFICLILRQKKEKKTLVSASDQDELGEERGGETGRRLEGESAYCFKLGWKNNPALPQLNIVL